MKKWIGPCLSLFLVAVLLFLSGPPLQSKQVLGTEGESPDRPLVLTQNKKDDDSSQYIQMMKGFQEILDGWLKSLNEKIDSEDVTRLEVRFYEILRNILEWVKEKVDAQIDSATQKKEQKERGVFRQTRWTPAPVSLEG
jgi:hypothetical protein